MFSNTILLAVVAAEKLAFGFKPRAQALGMLGCGSNKIVGVIRKLICDDCSKRFIAIDCRLSMYVRQSVSVALIDQRERDDCSSAIDQEGAICQLHR